MADREKVIKGLMHCHCRCGCNSNCPYFPILEDHNGGVDACTSQLADDALSLLKEQEPRVMTLEEVEDALDTVVWVDRPLLDNSSDEYALIDSYSRKTQIVELHYPFCNKDYRERAAYVTYGKTWRCWTARPTEEQRKMVKWE